MTDNPTFTLKVRAMDGDALLDKHALALLFGVDAELVAAHTNRQRSPGETMFNAELPEAWIKAGRRRSREAMAATGSGDMLDGLRYWALKDHGAELQLEVVP